ncbi:phosphoribosylaminoimidazole carboxylase [Candidatus Acidianus copahuensis]|uniref:N5-carboxyaminoimidazole ribonucleotide synthase n=1 Tax=Candidatus Acidianus copahuensis TaxID=1160895 RepID=A0A031LML2_9CREN|nr:5-(carboxyamino)imidazole ribonucleotide synthase [Candidatus Acidianus copahuensis]EZQ04736.1 phosphoribosylaminoimidazole carboxylase [Candidatus Acidianus copahuensis]
MFSQQNSKIKIGILGGGQLGRMMIIEGRNFPILFYVLGNKDEPACQVADFCFSEEEYKKMIDEVDVVTFEFEHVNDMALQYAEDREKLLPRINSVELKRERWKEKKYLKDHGFPVPRFEIAEGGEEALKILKESFNNIGVIKQSTNGYDGKGQYFIKGNPQDYSFLKENNCKFVVEEYVNFDFETSIIAVRKRRDFVAYTPTFNYNENGILIYNYGPYYDDRLEDIAKKLTESLNYVGTIGIEFFIRNNEILINEFAPRVHNTGHYTLDGTFTSQFEQHIRAITDLPLGDTSLLTPSGMVNVIGKSNVPLEALRLGKLYWYGKNEVRKRRKMGHINVRGEDLGDVREKIDNLLKLIYPQGLDL